MAPACPECHCLSGRRDHSVRWLECALCGHRWRGTDDELRDADRAERGLRRDRAPFSSVLANYEAGGSAGIYLAAPLGEAALAETTATRLLERDFRVVSHWHALVARMPGAKRDPSDDCARRAILKHNLEDMERADAFVVLAH